MSKVGGVSFKVGDVYQDTCIGISNEDSSYHAKDIAFGIWFHKSGFVYISEKGETYGPLQPYYKSDSFTIQIVKEANGATTKVLYSHNGIPFHLSRKVATLPMIVDATMNTLRGVLYDITWAPKFELPLPKVASGELVQFPFIRGVIYKDGLMTRINRVDTNWNSFASTYPNITKSSSVKGIQFRVNQNTNNIVVGLTSKENDENYRNIEFSFILKNDKTISITESSNYAPIDNLGPYEKGDLFSVVVNSNGQVNFIQNGQQLFTSSEVAKFPLRVMVSFDNLYNSISNIIYVSESGAFEQPPQEINPGQPVYWKHVHGVKAKPGYLKKIIPGDTYNAGSFSINLITETSTIGITFKPSYDMKEVVVGLSSSSSHIGPDSIEYAIKLSNRFITVQEKGVSKGMFKRFSINDRMDIVLSPDNKQVIYLHNGSPFYTSLTPPVFPLSADNSLKSTDSCVFDIMWTPRFVFDSVKAESGNFVIFKNIIGLDVTSVPGRIERIIDGKDKFDTNAFSTIGIQKPSNNSTTNQPYGFSFVAASRNMNMIVGLSNSDTANPDYCFRLYEKGGIGIMEKGIQVATIKSKLYDKGDRFSIYINGDEVFYAYNGNEFYSSKNSPKYPLGIHVSLGDLGAAIEKVIFISNENALPSSIAVGQSVYWGSVVDAYVSPGFVYRYSEYNAITTSKFFIETQQAIVKYDMVGGVSWKISGSEGYLGLSETSEIQNMVGMNYAIGTSSNGLLYVFERETIWEYSIISLKVMSFPFE